MNILFFIGNGFDINYGMHTRYIDFYPYLKKHSTTYNQITTQIQNNYEKWADYEAQLGQSVDKLDFGNVESFYDDKDEVDLLLAQYLQEEQDCISDSLIEDTKDEFLRSVIDFESALPDDWRERYRTIKNQPGEGHYRFVTLNYTNILDRLIDSIRKSDIKISHLYRNIYVPDVLDNVVHIHGTLERGLITGVNDKLQINNEILLENAMFLDALIKERMNAGIGSNKTKTVSAIIEESNIIILFGASIGDTDNNWWRRIIDWLFKSENNLLYICEYVSDASKYELLPAVKMRKDEEIKNLFLSKMDSLSGIQKEQLRKQIFVLFNPNIFRFK